MTVPLRRLVLLLLVIGGLLSLTPGAEASSSDKPRPDASEAASAAPASTAETGGEAVLADVACTAEVLEANDDLSSDVVGLPFTVDFFGTSYDQLYVNNNGNVTFDGPLGTFTPDPLDSSSTPIVAPYWADVDTTGEGSGLVTWGVTTYEGHQAFCVNWLDVGYFAGRTDLLNSFQLLLVDRPDTAAGNFDIVFNYGSLRWEAGEASGGVDGLGGSPARAGYSNGSDQTFEVAGSGVSGAFLDSSPTGLVQRTRDSEVLGRLVFPVREGAPPLPGRLTVIQATNPADARDFAYTTSGAGLTPFALDDDDEADATLVDRRTFDELVPGTYAVTQDAVDGWRLATLSCDTGETVNLALRRATVALGASEEVTCTFTNAPRPRPDGLVATSATGPFGGDGVYATTVVAAQTRTSAISPGATKNLYVRAANDGTVLEDLRVRAVEAGSARYTARYFRGATNITTAVRSNGGYLIDDLAPGASVTIRVQFHAATNAPRGSSRRADVTVSSVTVPTERDVVRAQVRRP